MKTFEVKKERSFGIFLLVTGIVIIGVALGIPITKGTNSAIDLIIGCMITIPFIGLFTWCWLDTYYSIENGVLTTRTGPFVWKIAIKDINYIRLNQKILGGARKPTLAWNGMEIKYKKYRSLYVSPLIQDEFISELKKENSTIDIKQK